jgi:parvulin-like peptidyl-prolyl isomerase
MRSLHCALSLLFLLAGPLAAELVDGIVLRVDNRMATLSEYQLRRGERVQQILTSNLPAEEKTALIEDAGRSTLLEIYQELLLLSRGDQLGLRVSGDEIDRALDQNRQRMGLASTAQLEAALAESGRTLEDLRERTAVNLLVQQVVGREVQSKAIPSEEEARRYYREHPDEFAVPAQVRIREVVVLADRFADGAALDDAGQRWRARLDAGAGLDQIAIEGGALGETTGVVDLEWVALPDLDTALREGIGDSPAGSVVGPIPARGGLHLVEVVERKEAGTLPFSEAEEAIRRQLAAGRFEEKLEELLDQVEEHAWIVVNAPEDAVGFLERGSTRPPSGSTN